MTPSPSSEYDEEDLGFSSGGGGASCHQMPQSTMNKFGYHQGHTMTSGNSVGVLPIGTISQQRAMVHHTATPSVGSTNLMQSPGNNGGLKMSMNSGGKDMMMVMGKNGRPGMEQYHQQHHQFQSVSASSAESLPSASGSSTKALVHSPNRFSDSSGCGVSGGVSVAKEARKFADALVPNGKTLKECILDSLDSDAANFKAVEIINQQRPFR